MKPVSRIVYKVAAELFDLAKVLGGIMDEIAFTPYGQLRINKIPRTTYYDKLKRFERHGLVKKVRKSYGNVYVLTDRAKQLRGKPRIKARRLDGLSTVIIFDIPEDKHKARDNFRRYLIKNGYTQIQKSVFISPFKVFLQLRDFIYELGIVPQVTILSARVDQL